MPVRCSLLPGPLCVATGRSVQAGRPCNPVSPPSKEGPGRGRPRPSASAHLSVLRIFWNPAEPSVSDGSGMTGPSPVPCTLSGRGPGQGCVKRRRGGGLGVSDSTARDSPCLSPQPCPEPFPSTCASLGRAPAPEGWRLRPAGPTRSRRRAGDKGGLAACILLSGCKTERPRRRGPDSAV